MANDSVVRARRAHLAYEEWEQTEYYEQRVQPLFADAKDWPEANALLAFASAVEAAARARSPATSLAVDASARIVGRIGSPTSWTRSCADPVELLSREPPESLPSWMRTSPP